MREIKFEYVGRNLTFNTIVSQVLTLDEIQAGRNIFTFFDPKNDNCAMLAKRQYTGLKDKNGKEIYESDRVKIGKEIYTVCWNGAGAFFDLAHKDDTDMDTDYLLSDAINGMESIEVVGHIYENPELLENGDKNRE